MRWVCHRLGGDFARILTLPTAILRKFRVLQWYAFVSCCERSNSLGMGQVHKLSSVRRRDHAHLAGDHSHKKVCFLLCEEKLPCSSSPAGDTVKNFN